jgi:hypothetical protein
MPLQRSRAVVFLVRASSYFLGAAGAGALGAARGAGGDEGGGAERGEYPVGGGRGVVLCAGAG